MHSLYKKIFDTNTKYLDDGMLCFMWDFVQRKALFIINIIFIAETKERERGNVNNSFSFEHILITIISLSTHYLFDKYIHLDCYYKFSICIHLVLFICVFFIALPFFFSIKNLI